MNKQKNYLPIKISLLKQLEDKKVQLEIQLFWYLRRHDWM